MDALIEILGDILEEVLSWAASSKRVPKAIPYILFSLLHIGLLALFFLIAYNTDLLLGQVLCGILFGACFISWYLCIRKVHRR